MNILSLILLIIIPDQSAMLIPSTNNPLMLSRNQEQGEDAPKEFQCGQILVRGSQQLTQAEMCYFLEQASNNPHDLQARDSVEAQVTKEYHRRGFLETTLSWKDAEKSNKPASATTVVLTVAEGPVYRLRRLEMIGNDETRDNVIRRRVAVNEGNAFDEELLELSIKRINQLGIFQEFTREDIDVKVNKKGKFVDLTFRLKEK